MARNRPGKREREAMARARFADYRSEVVARNLAELATTPRPERIHGSRFGMHGAPSGYATSSANRDKLRERSCTVGFSAPRGFYSPRDHVSKREVTPGQMAPRDASRPAPARTFKRWSED